MNIGRKFRLIGNTTVFVCVSEYKAAGFIPAVTGITEDVTKKTHARVADIIWLDETVAERVRRETRELFS